MKVKFADLAVSNEIRQDFTTQYSNIANGVIGATYFLSGTGPMGIRGLQGPTGSPGPIGPTGSFSSNISQLIAGTGSNVNRFNSAVQVSTDDFSVMGPDYGQFRVYSPATNQAIGLSTYIDQTNFSYGRILSVNVGQGYTPLQLGFSSSVSLCRIPLNTDSANSVIVGRPLVFQDTYFTYRAGTGGYVDVVPDSAFANSQLPISRQYVIPDIHQNAKFKFGSSNFYQDNVKLSNNTISANTSTAVNFEGSNTIQFGDFANSTDSSATPTKISTTNAGITIPTGAVSTVYKVTYTLNLTPQNTIPNNVTNPFTAIIGCSNTSNLQPSLNVSKCSVSPAAYVCLTGSCSVVATSNDIVSLTVQTSVDSVINNGFICLQGIY